MPDFPKYNHNIFSFPFKFAYALYRRIENPRIVLLDCSLEYKKGESQVSANCWSAYSTGSHERALGQCIVP